MKTKQKINSAIAKALASKIYQELLKKHNNWKSKQEKEIEEKLYDDPLYLEYIERDKVIDNLIGERNKISSKLMKKYKIKTQYYSFKTIYVDEKAFKNPIPELENIKNDLLLMSWSQDEDLTSDQLIAKLVKKYSK